MHLLLALRRGGNVERHIPVTVKSARPFYNTPTTSHQPPATASEARPEPGHSLEWNRIRLVPASATGETAPGTFWPRRAPRAAGFTTMVFASQIRAGMAIVLENQTYRVVAAEYHPGQGKMGGVMHARLQNVDTGTFREHSLRAELSFKIFQSRGSRSNSFTRTAINVVS